MLLVYHHFSIMPHIVVVMCKVYPMSVDIALSANDINIKFSGSLQLSSLLFTKSGN